MRNALRLNPSTNPKYGFEDIKLYYNGNYIESIRIDYPYHSINYRINYIKENL